MPQTLVMLGLCHLRCWDEILTFQLILNIISCTWRCCHAGGRKVKWIGSAKYTKSVICVKVIIIFFPTHNFQFSELHEFSLTVPKSHTNISTINQSSTSEGLWKSLSLGIVNKTVWALDTNWLLTVSGVCHLQVIWPLLNFRKCKHQFPHLKNGGNAADSGGEKGVRWAMTGEGTWPPLSSVTSLASVFRDRHPEPGVRRSCSLQMRRERFPVCPGKGGTWCWGVGWLWAPWSSGQVVGDSPSPCLSLGSETIQALLAIIGPPLSPWLIFLWSLWSFPWVVAGRDGSWHGCP